MKKLLLSLALVAGLGLAANAQSKKDPAMGGSKIGVGADFAFPMGDFGDFWNFGVGGSLNFQAPIANKTNFVGEAGYLNFTSKEFAGQTVSFGTIPVKAGVRYFLAENFYAQGQVGAAFSTESNGGTAFVYAPSLGVEFPVADKMAVDFGARYEGWSKNGTSSFIGLRAALNFGL
ncbi:outer membrane beta-barrel protein [Pedobacter sp. UBA4863]|mgnify:CR=1 FL=1|uniref:outer membrane beta-barrel protein n=1 Tax=Pedobacter sp. UBA4863 TaxID=1947060 RepID=UPI0025E1058F|nr:outer membrane beta-barrel protein [Pedobacter sp. UBA4863]